MKAWKITAPHTIEQVSSPSEPVGPGQVKIKIGYCLVSLPDIMTYRDETTAKLPVVPGGSCCGMVIETGEGVTDLERGDRVFVHSQKCCGACVACKTGHYSSCENIQYCGITCDGFMRDFAVVQAIDCTKLPERIRSRDAVFLDYLAIAVQTISALDIKKGEHIAITGASILGIVLGQVALYYQTVPILVDINPEYLDKANQIGIYYTINATKCGARDKIFHITGGKMAERVAHIASGEIPISDSMSFAGRGGRLAIIGRYGCCHKLDCSLQPIIENVITIIGVNNGAKNTQVAVNMLANKAVSVSSLVTREVGFNDIPSVFKESNGINKHLKTIIKIN